MLGLCDCVCAGYFFCVCVCFMFWLCCVSCVQCGILRDLYGFVMICLVSLHLVSFGTKSIVS